MALLSNSHQSMNRAIASPLILAAALGIAFPTESEAKVVPRIGHHEIVVLCVQERDWPKPFFENCGDWVQRFNLTVAPYFEHLSDGAVTLRFKLPAEQNGGGATFDDWLQVDDKTGHLYGVAHLQETLFDVIDSKVDFTDVDAVLVVTNEKHFMGQTFGGGTGLETNPNTVSTPWVVEEHENIWRENAAGNRQGARMMSVAVVAENAHPNAPPPPNDRFLMEGVVAHEISHWFSFNDRYSDTDPTYGPQGFDLMARQGQFSPMPHYSVFDQYRLNYMSKRDKPAIVRPGTQQANIDINPPTTPARLAKGLPGILVPFTDWKRGPFQGYSVEFRSKEAGVAWLDTVAEEGIVVTRIDSSLTDKGRDFDLVSDPNYTPANHDNTETAWEFGDVFRDVTNGIEISVDRMFPSQAAAQLGQVPYASIGVINLSAADFKPEIEIRKWDSNYQSDDIWIDSPVNGYGRYEDHNGNRDRPAVEVNMKNPQVINRLWARVHNHGRVPARNVKVAFSAAPSGIEQQFTGIGDATIAEIPAGSYADAYVEWVIDPDVLKHGHVCVRAEADGLQNEINIANNRAQENIIEFNSTKNSPWSENKSELLVGNNNQDPLTVKMAVSGLPKGWSYSFVPETFEIPPGQTQTVKVVISPEPQLQPKDKVTYEPGYVADVRIHAYGRTSRGKSYEMGGVLHHVRLSKQAVFSVQSFKWEHDSVKGTICLADKKTHAPVIGHRVGFHLVFDPSTPSDWKYETTDAKGCVVVEVKTLMNGQSRVGVYYRGNDLYAPIPPNYFDFNSGKD